MREPTTNLEAAVRLAIKRLQETRKPQQVKTSDTGDILFDTRLTRCPSCTRQVMAVVLETCGNGDLTCPCGWAGYISDLSDIGLWGCSWCHGQGFDWDAFDRKLRCEKCEGSGQFKGTPEQMRAEGDAYVAALRSGATPLQLHNHEEIEYHNKCYPATVQCPGCRRDFEQKDVRNWNSIAVQELCIACYDMGDGPVETYDCKRCGRQVRSTDDCPCTLI